jgi:glyceraldehyde-3-phosphate dehydrogenase (ferredoxin)
VKDHYLAQFNQETIIPKQFSHCGEPCPAVCKKLHGQYKKDYEPYQTMGPLTGIFDQRAAELVNHHADALGFDAIQIGGQVAWVMECLHDGLLDAKELGLPQDVPARPAFEPEAFEAVADSDANGRLARAILDKCIQPDHWLTSGMRAAAHKIGPPAVARAVYLANGPEGWMVPNQYWVPGMLAPMAVMGKYYVHYGADFLPPGELGRACAERMIAEITTDNAGVCRFHRGWSEQLWPKIVNGHFGTDIDYPAHHERLAKNIHRQGQPVYWESQRISKMLHGYLRRIRETVPGDPHLRDWLNRFEADRKSAARAYWDELCAGIDQRMEEIPG